MFNCRELDGGLSVLHKDYSIKCSTDQHAAFELIAAAYVACVSLGIPLYMVRAVVLARRLPCLTFLGLLCSDRCC